MAKRVKGTAAKGTIAIYASPKCCTSNQLLLYKSYFNVAWFVRAYAPILKGYRVLATDETIAAINCAFKCGLQAYEKDWKVPHHLDLPLESVGGGFDAQVALAAKVADNQLERVLIFQDPDDVLEHLPEMHAMIRNCTLANVGLHINAGATFWAEARWQEAQPLKGSSGQALSDYGTWRQPSKVKSLLHEKINPPEQTIAFIAHDGEKEKMSAFACKYHDILQSQRLKLTGTSGTCKHILDMHARLGTLPLTLKGPGSTPHTSHGPTGGDVIIADQIIQKWPHAGAYSVRTEGLSHTVFFFIDHKHAQPHEADIHVLLRTCLHPARGVHLILNEKTAHEWGDTIRKKLL